MLLKDLITKIKSDLSADRIGPDTPFTHWRLFFPKTMLKICQAKFRKFSDTAQFRAGAYAMGCSKIEIGRRVVIRPGCKLFGASSHLTTTIIIEDDVLIASGVNIHVNSHRFDNPNIPFIDQGNYPSKPVLIKKGCWIGANAIILPGVTIGENSVIGAGSVVTKSIPPRVVAVGNPAKVIKKIE